MSDAFLFRRSYQQRVLSVAGESRIAYWPMNEPAGAVAFDVGGSRYNGAYTGVELNYPGIGDGLACPFFDGTNDFNNIYSAALAAAFNGQEGSIAVWVKVSGSGVWTDATQRNAMNFRADASNILFLGRSATNNTLVWSYVAGGTTKSVTSAAFGGSVDWIHLAMTWSKSADQMKAYANGTQIGATQTGLGTFAGALSTTRTVIGASITTPANVWSGYLAHAALWTRALTAAEVAIIAGVN